MTRLVAGIDVSGNPAGGNHIFLAFVIGTTEKLDSLRNKLGQDKIHMSKIKNKDVKKQIITRVSFDGNESTAFCFKISRDKIIKPIIQSKKIKKNKFAQNKVYYRYNRILMNHIHEKCEQFLQKHNHSIREIYIQCDRDCRRLVTDNGLNACNVESTHDLADIVAWANNNGMEPDGVNSDDLVLEIEGELRKDLQLS